MTAVTQTRHLLRGLMPRKNRALRPKSLRHLAQKIL